MTHPSTVADTLDAGDGWIEWAGGECPVAPGTRGDVQFRDQTRAEAEAENDTDVLDGLDWNHEGQAWDVIAYRVVQP